MKNNENVNNINTTTDTTTGTIVNTETNKDLTELVFILDRSGSMAGLEADTIGGFNAMIEKQKKEPGRAFVTTVLFDNESETLHDRIPLGDVPKMTDADYTVRGCTALIDAIGGAIRHIETIHKYARPADVPAHTLFMITTDGMENASRRFSSDEVKRMICRKKEESGWEFLFIGANIDAVETASRFGIDEDRAVNYHADKRGTEKLFASMAAPLSAMRAGKKVSREWKADLEQDFKSRKKDGK